MPIAAPKPTEYSDWYGIWRAFVDHMDATLPEAQYQNSWDRVQDPNGDLHALLARDDESGAVVGIAQYMVITRSWKSTSVVYLEDLFVLPSARRKGYGRQLLLAVAAAGAAKGCDTMHWLTGHGNERAQRLYDGLGAKSHQRWYDLTLPFVEPKVEEGNGKEDGGMEGN